MVIFYKWKKYNEIQLTKKQNGLKYSKNDESSTLPRAHGNSKNERRQSNRVSRLAGMNGCGKKIIRDEIKKYQKPGYSSGQAELSNSTYILQPLFLRGS